MPLGAALKPTGRQPAYKVAAAGVKRYIEAHQLAGGDPLPSEAQLCQELGMSRATLREGLKALESLGIIHTRHGEGVFVAHFSFDPIVHNLPYSIAAQGASLRDLVEVRTALEVGLIARVALCIEAADVASLRQLAMRMVERSQHGHSYAEEDRAFHATLFRCLGNPFLLSLIDLFWQVFSRLADRLPAAGRAERRAIALAHLRVVELLEAGDVPALEQAHRRHFDEISQRLNRADAAAANPMARRARPTVAP
jgi:DNA-binding FadR family transcriptional regulator